MLSSPVFLSAQQFQDKALFQLKRSFQSSTAAAAILLHNNCNTMTSHNKQVLPSDTNCKLRQPHFVLVPYFQPGHMIPMVDIARHLAERGALVTFITTPVNAARISSVIESVKEAGLPLDFVELSFPCKEAGLPEGCENADLAKSVEQVRNFFEAVSMLAEPLKCYLKTQEIKPTCMISDMCNPWTMSVANELGIPRLIFHGPSCLYILLTRILKQHNIYDNVDDEFETFVVPDFPHRMEVSAAQVSGFFNKATPWEKMKNEVWQADETADGVVINSFDDLEPSYIECYKKLKGTGKIWTIGPFCIYNHNNDIETKASRGNKASISEQRILAWLDSHAPKSVVFINFGSCARHNTAQLIELGCGLEASKRPFIWVIKDVENSPELEKWLNEGFEARISSGNVGLIIKGWAPQMVILSHCSVGGYLTHCGWNSIIEAISEGVPMMTWPHFADQHVNEKLVVEILKIGISLGVTATPVARLNAVEEQIVVQRKDVEKAVSTLMDESNEEVMERRMRATELMHKARKATAKGGSSYENVNQLIAKFTR